MSRIVIIVGGFLCLFLLVEINLDGFAPSQRPEWSPAQLSSCCVVGTSSFWDRYLTLPPFVLWPRSVQYNGPLTMKYSSGLIRRKHVASLKHVTWGSFIYRVGFLYDLFKSSMEKLAT